MRTGGLVYKTHSCKEISIICVEWKLFHRVDGKRSNPQKGESTSPFEYVIPNLENGIRNRQFSVDAICNCRPSWSNISPKLEGEQNNMRPI